VVKNKLAPPFQEAEFEIRWGHGIDAASDLLELGIARGVVEKSGHHLSWSGEQLGQGKERARELLRSQPELMAKLRAAVVTSLTLMGSEPSAQAA